MTAFLVALAAVFVVAVAVIGLLLVIHGAGVDRAER